MVRGRQALITGGTGGIGLGIAKAMLSAGYDVTVTGFSDEEVARVPNNSRLSAIKLDVTQPESVAEALGRFEKLAALVNCAGVIFRDGAEYEIDTFQRVIEVNLTGTMRVCVAARPKLAAAGGAIVNTASMLSFFGGPWCRPTAPRKAGLCSSRSRWPVPGRLKESASTPSLQVGL